jgi:cephalosporin-C deacetylase-like acetyl esterase
MNRHKSSILCIVALLLGAVLVGAASAQKADIVVKVVADRTDALYACNENATFLISVTDKGQPVTEGNVTVKLSRDFVSRVDQQKVALGPQPAKLSGTLSEPGFLECEAVFVKEGKSYRGLAGAGFDPLQIKPAAASPDDFDAFWQAGRDELAKIPLDVQLTPLPQLSNDKHEVFQISFANLDNTRLYGFLCIPKNRKPPFPACMELPAAGVTKSTAPSSFQWVDSGALYLDMYIHDFDPLHPPKDVDQTRKSYQTIGAPHREKYYFRRAILGLDRAIDYLASRPDYDGKHLLVVGVSQGGGLSLILGGLNHKVTAITSGKPAICDHQAARLGRKPGWPGLLHSAPADQREQWAAMSEYFDAVNFARRIKAPTMLCTGFIDSTCPPSSAYAAYNVIEAPKYVYNLPWEEHTWSQDQANAPRLQQWWGFVNKWRLGQLGLQPVMPFPDPSK